MGIQEDEQYLEEILIWFEIYRLWGIYVPSTICGKIPSLQLNASIWKEKQIKIKSGLHATDKTSKNENNLPGFDM